MLHAVEPVRLQQGAQRLVCSRLRVAARQHDIEERLHHTAQLHVGAARGAKLVELRPHQGRERVAVLSQQRWYGQRVIAGRHERRAAVEQVGEGPALVNGEVIDHRLHREGQGVLELPLGGGHDLLQALLCQGFLLRGEDEPHAPAGHPAKHPESPERIAEFRAHSPDERLREIIRGPRNNGLDRLAEVARGRCADPAHVSPLERR